MSENQTIAEQARQGDRIIEAASALRSLGIPQHKAVAAITRALAECGYSPGEVTRALAAREQRTAGQS